MGANLLFEFIHFYLKRRLMIGDFLCVCVFFSCFWFISYFLSSFCGMYWFCICDRPLASDRFDSPKPSSLFSPIRESSAPAFNDTPLNDARRRAERVIAEDSFFDVRGARVPKSSIGEAIREFDDEVYKFKISFTCCTSIFFLNLYLVFLV